MKNNTCDLTVVIPCYCCSATIKSAVFSVLYQTLIPSELILIDDGSTDNTLNILYELQNSYPKLIRVIKSEENLGVSKARNLGWENAKSNYLAFLDADDEWHPKKIEIQYNFMKKTHSVFLCGHNHDIILRSNMDRLAKFFQTIPRISGIKELNFKDFLIRNHFVTPSVMVKRNIPFRFPEDQRFIEDHYLWLEMTSAGMKVVKLNCSLTVIRKKMFGVSGLSSHLWLMERTELLVYWKLLRQGKISIAPCLLLQTFSLLKFFRRVLKTYSGKFLLIFLK